MKREKLISLMLASAITFTGIGGAMSFSATRLSSSLPAMAAGSDFAFSIDNSDDLWAWGSNDNGQLTSKASGTKNVSAKKIYDTATAIAAGAEHSLIVDGLGRLYTTGNNAYGQLGHNSKIAAGVMTEVLDGVVDVAAGDNHSMALDDRGYLYIWGRNNSGQLGNGKTSDSYSSTPTRIMTDVKAIAADGNVSMALKTNGDLYVWGSNNYYQVGNGSRTDQTKPVKVLSNVKAFDTGGRHCLAVNTSGYLYAWGYGSYGQIGNGKKYSYSKPTRVNAGTLSSSGKTETTKLGKVKSVSAGSYHSVILLESGRSYACGIYKFKKDGNGKLLRYAITKPLLVGTGVFAVESGDDFYMLMNSKGYIYARGINDSGQLGNGNNDAVPSNTAYRIKFNASSSNTSSPGNSTPTPTPTQAPSSVYNNARLLHTRTTTSRGLDGNSYTLITKTYEGTASNGNPYQIVEVDYGTREALIQTLDRDSEFAFTEEGRLNSNGVSVPWDAYGVFLKDKSKLLYVRGTIDNSLISQLGTKVANAEAVHVLLGSTVGTGGGQTLNHYIYGSVLIQSSQSKQARGSDGINYTYHVTQYRQVANSGTAFVIEETDYGTVGAIRNLISLNDVFVAPSQIFYLSDGTRQSSNIAYYISGTKLIKTTNLSDVNIIKQLGTKVTTPAELYKALGLSTDRVGDTINHSIFGSVKIKDIQNRSATGSDGKVYSYVERSYEGSSFTAVETDYGTKDIMRALISQDAVYSFTGGSFNLSDGTPQSSRTAMYVNGAVLYRTYNLADVSVIAKLGSMISSGADIYRVQGWAAGSVGQTITHSIFGQVRVSKDETVKRTGDDSKEYSVRVTTYVRDTGAYNTQFTVTETSYGSKAAMKALIKNESFTIDNRGLTLSNGTQQASSKAYYVHSSTNTLYSTEDLRDVNTINQLGTSVSNATDAYNAVK